jgi:hypothetical protein
VRVGDTQAFQQALDATVLTELAVQRVEAHIGRNFFQPGGKVAIDVDLGDAIALALEGLGAGCTRAQAHLALGRPAAHEHGDVAMRALRRLPDRTAHRRFPSPRSSC